ncbi:hypothetical protein ERE07_09675 [Allopusillimonas ginsengisoli]|nr:hypothetical protein ERE07_09675 [Allopusillimonas ginsengisoli]
MTPTEFQLHCTHQPYYQKGCITCNARYVKLLRPSREKQDQYLAGLPTHEREQTIDILRKERASHG